MSPYVPQIRANDLIRVAKKLGFEFDRQTGSHAIYYRTSDKARVVIPVHAGKDIKRKTLYGIIDDMGITADRLKELL